MVNPGAHHSFLSSIGQMTERTVKDQNEPHTHAISAVYISFTQDTLQLKSPETNTGRWTQSPSFHSPGALLITASSGGADRKKAKLC